MISQNLLTLRRRNRLSQEDVAERVGVSRQAVAKWEAGETVPDLTNCVALAQMYDVTLDDLVNYRSEEHEGLDIPPSGKYLFGAVTVGEKGQIVIPVKARRVFGIKPGDRLIFLGDIARGLAIIKEKDLLAMLNNKE